MMSLLRRLFSEPGYYELVGGPQCGKTTTGLLLATCKRMDGRALWMTTSTEHSPDLVKRVAAGRLREGGWVCETVEAFFAIIAGAGRGDFIIMDSLATLAPDHLDAQQIAPSVTRHWVEPNCPVLVINQDRHPVASGGIRWRAGRRGVFKLKKHRDLPFLLSRLWPTDLWLTWASGSPELRMLTEAEERLWLPKSMYGGVM